MKKKNTSCIGLTEVRLFLTFFLLYSIFISYINWNENSRFGLTMAIVDEGRLSIDTFHNNTGDRAIYEGHYYSDKEPGMSLLAVPTYFLYRLFNPPPQYPDDLYRSIIHPSYIRAIGLTIIFTSCLFGAASVAVLHMLLGLYTKNSLYRLLIAIVYGGGTLIFTYSRLLMNHAAAAFFVILSFYLIKKQRHIWSGLFAGLALTTQISTLAFFAAFAIYLMPEKKHVLKLALGMLIGSLPLLVYNYLIFGNPFILTYFHTDPLFWGGQFSPRFLSAIPVALELLILPYRGLFIYVPITMLSLFGLFRMKERKDAILIASLFLIFLLYNTQITHWNGGSSFGPRHFVVLMPFLMIPLVYVMNYRKSFYALGVISIFITISGFNMVQDGFYEIDTFIPYESPLTDYYIPFLLDDGPNSNMFCSVVTCYGNQWLRFLTALAGVSLIWLLPRP